MHNINILIPADVSMSNFTPMGRYESNDRRKNFSRRQTSLGLMSCNREEEGQIERIGSPKLMKQSYSTEKYTGLPTSIRPSASMGNIPMHRNRLQTRGQFSVFRSSNSLLLEEPENQHHTINESGLESQGMMAGARGVY